MRIQYTFWKLVIFAFFFPSNITTAVDILKTGSELKMVASGFAFTEGPAVDSNGDVYFTDQPNDRILKWRSDNNTVSDWLKPAGRSNGMYFDQNGNLIEKSNEPENSRFIQSFLFKEIKPFLSKHESIDKILEKINAIKIILGFTTNEFFFNLLA